MKIAELLIEAKAGSANPTVEFEGLELFDPDAAEKTKYDEGDWEYEKKRTNTAVGFRVKGADARAKLIFKLIRSDFKRASKDVHWIHVHGKALEILINGKPAKAYATAKKMITFFGKEVDQQTTAKGERAAKKAAAGPSLPRAKTQIDHDKEKYGKDVVRRVTARKHGGDDYASWAVFVDGRAKWTGLTQREVPYYKTQEYQRLSGQDK